MSQMSFQGLNPNLGCFPLVKFSHHTGPFGAKTHTWTHVNYRNDLDFVLKELRLVDDYGTYETKCWMKVNGGSEVLESQDLTQLIQYCRDFNQASGLDHPVELVVKCPFLAMKYPKTPQTVRRFQVKFRNEADFLCVVNTLRNLGLPLVDKGTPTSLPPAISPASSMLSTSSLASARISLPGPGSASHAGLRTPVASSDAALTSPAKSDFKVPQRPASVQSEGGRMDQGMPHFTPIQFHTSSITPLSSARPLTRVSSFQEPPSQMHSIYLSQMQHESQGRRISYPASQTAHGEHATESTNAPMFISQLQAGRGQHAETREGSSRLLTQSPFFPLQRDEPRRQTNTTDALDELRSQPSQFAQRPASTPAQSADVQNLWIPPRRELPFLKPKDSVRAEPSPVLDLPPLPQPTPVSRTDSIIEPASVDELVSTPPVVKQAPKKRVAQRKPTTKPPNNPDPALTETLRTTVGTEEQISPLASKSAVVPDRPSSASAALVSKAAAPARKRAAHARPSSTNKRAKMVDRATQTIRMEDLQQQAPMRESIPDLVVGAPSPASPPAEYLDRLDALITKHHARAPPIELWETPAYADADDETRESMLNEFICENLGNKEFLQLCQDAEFAWRRLGLGL